MLRRRFIIEWIVVLTVAILGSLAFQFSFVGTRLDNLFFDQAVASRSTVPSAQIIIVEIDEESLSTVGRWPWTRDRHGELIDRLTLAKPAAIGYDVLFTEPTNSQDDERLRAALEAAQNVVLPAFVEMPGRDGRPADIVLPIDPLAKAARAIGHVNVRFDPDGIVRQSFSSVSDGQYSIAHFTSAIAGTVSGKPVVRAPQQSGMLIPFHIRGSYQRVSAAKVLSGEVPAAFFDAKIVLVGGSAQGLGDILPVPGSAGSAMPGIEVQANMLDAELSGTAISSPPALARTAAVVALIFGLLLFFWRVGPTASLLGSLGLAAATLVMSGVSLTSFHLWLPPGGILVGTLLSYPLWSWRRLAALNAFVETETKLLRASIDATARTDREPTGLDSVAQAASALKSVIGNLEQMKSFMARVIDNAPDAIAVLDQKGHITLTNAKAATLFEDRFQNAPFAEVLARIAPTAVPNSGDLALPDGRHLMMKASSFGGEDDQTGGSIVRLADVTAQREAQRQRDEMLEFLSHDMRSPQAAIVALIDHHSSKPDSEFPAQRVRQQALASLKLADDFVQLAKLASIEPVFEDIDIVSLANEAIDRCYVPAKAKEVGFARPDDLEDAFALVDGSMLLRAFVNLIDNAIKYGGDQAVVAVNVAADEAAICICISDSGPGIPKERLDKLFQRFGASNSTGKMSAGLGLAYVKRAIDVHGGTINCASSKSGTRFDLSIPRSRT